TMSALVLKSERLGSSSLGIGFPLAGAVKKKFFFSACSSCSAKLRWAGVGLKSYLSSGKSSDMAMSLRPMSFQESRTTLEGLSAGFVATSFLASWAWTGIAAIAMANKAAASSGVFVIFVSPRLGERNLSGKIVLCKRWIGNLKNKILITDDTDVYRG